jgi:hypothetical protein
MTLDGKEVEEAWEPPNTPCQTSILTVQICHKSSQAMLRANQMLNKSHADFLEVCLIFFWVWLAEIHYMQLLEQHPSHCEHMLYIML